MDWDRRQELSTWVLDDVFDRAKGWYVTEEEASIERKLAPDGNPTYLVSIGRIRVSVFEQRVWKTGSERNVSPGRICAMVEYSGINITKPELLLSDSYVNRGLPAFGINSAGQPSLHTAFPIAPGFPVDLARRQLMVCIGLLAIEAEKYLAAWTSKTTKPSRNVDWDLVGNIAGVTAKFVRALAGF